MGLFMGGEDWFNTSTCSVNISKVCFLLFLDMKTLAIYIYIYIYTYIRIYVYTFITYLCLYPGDNTVT